MIDWNRTPSQEEIEATMQALQARKFNPSYVPDREKALATLLQWIPKGAEVMEGFSTTLIEIGFVDHLKNSDDYIYWRKKFQEETDEQKRRDLRRQATTAEYFLGSVQAIAMTGEVISCDNSGSRQGGYVYGAKNVIWVVGVNKIVPDLETALRRTREHALPLEDARMKSLGAKGSRIGKLVVYEYEIIPQRIRTLLIGEKLGF
ncbi:MAG: lactate utilization protein [Chloroflexi bacterium]|nr:lactate utilization protein [Chloroflexota bacterium]